MLRQICRVFRPNLLPFFSDRLIAYIAVVIVLKFVIFSAPESPFFSSQAIWS